MKFLYLLFGITLLNSVGEPRPFFQLQHEALVEIDKCMSRDDINRDSLTSEIKNTLLEIAKINGNVQRRKNQKESYHKLNSLFVELKDCISAVSSNPEGNSCRLWKVENIISQTDSDEGIEQFINPVVRVRFERQKIRNVRDYYRVNSDFYRKCSNQIFNITNRMKAAPNRVGKGDQN